MDYNRADWLRTFSKWKAEDDSIREWGCKYIECERELLCSEGGAWGDGEPTKSEPTGTELARFFPAPHRCHDHATAFRSGLEMNDSV